MRPNDRGDSTMVGTLLMLALVTSMVPVAITLRNAISEEARLQAEAAKAEAAAAQAHAEAARRAEYCARNPAVGPPMCETEEPFPGYLCKDSLDGTAIVCTKRTP